MKEWQEDTAETLQKCWEHDAHLWGFNNKGFLKDMDEYPELTQSIRKHMSVIKELFLHVAARDNFPFIKNPAAEEFTAQSGLLDYKNVVKDAINRAFIAATRHSHSQSD